MRASQAVGTTCGENSYTVDITVNDCYASLGNYVWLDENGDGVQDPSELPIEGATVTLSTCVNGVKGAEVSHHNHRRKRQLQLRFTTTGRVLREH